MKSKEFIRNYINCVGSSQETKEEKEDLKYFKKVYKDLERLEVLENNNQELNKIIGGLLKSKKELNQENERLKERLETLEKENQELKEYNKYLKSEGFPTEYKVLKDNYKFLKEDFDDLKKENLEEINLRIRTQMQCSKLEKEKHTLENEIEILKCRIDQLSYRNVSQENEKLKNALEIIKDKLKLEFNLEEYWKGVHYHLWSENGCEITKQEYDLLKEVLGDA